MDAAMDHLGPLFENEKTIVRGKFLIGTVKGDLHDIGKNIVTMMLKGSGWEVSDLGLDVPPDRFCKAVQEGDYDVLGMSALLTTTMDNVVLTMKALTDAGLRDKVKIMIGGAPVTQDFADYVGADAWGEDGWDAVVKAEEMILA
jgi:5-methyltetrahydrofolate--homocysteine methyltransferase